MEENCNLLRDHRVRSFVSELSHEKDIFLDKFTRNEQHTILPAPYFFTLYDNELAESLYISPNLKKLYGISRDIIYDENEHLLFDVILEDEEPAVVKFVKSIWNDHYRCGKKTISDRVFTADYCAETASGDILYIMHQYEVFSLTKSELPKSVIARFVDIIWLFGDEKERIVKFYIYNRQTHKIERCIDKQVSEDSAIRLTPREEEVQELINHGFTSNQIAGKLDISTETVKTHRKNIKAKHTYA